MNFVLSVSVGFIRCVVFKQWKWNPLSVEYIVLQENKHVQEPSAIFTSHICGYLKKKKKRGTSNKHLVYEHGISSLQYTAGAELSQVTDLEVDPDFVGRFGALNLPLLKPMSQRSQDAGRSLLQRTL